MRIDRVYIDGFRNLQDVEADFDEGCLTTVIIGQNGAGKSNLIEAIAEIFRHVDLNEGRLRFTFEIDYVIDGRKVRIDNREGATVVLVDGERLRMTEFQRQKSLYFPDLIFGYYSGSGRRLEKLFDRHQERYYNVINKDNTEAAYVDAISSRRLFYCRPIHGVFALLAHFSKPQIKGKAAQLIVEKLGITGFHSALALFKEPSWFSSSRWKSDWASKKENGTRGRRSRDELRQQALDLWGARGPAGECARLLLRYAFHPITTTARVVDDYRDKPKEEAQLACFVRDQQSLHEFASLYESDQDLFTALEAVDISDMFRQFLVWVTRRNDQTGDISFSDLSDGERQLLMVLGLIRVSRGKRALFLLDEPDTHLNPAWQLDYLELIKDWTEVAAESDLCQIVMTSHNPLTIASLEAREVRIMSVSEENAITVSVPFVDPKGLGFSGVLTDIFGHASTLDKPTQLKIDRRNELARQQTLSTELERELQKINSELRDLGFLYDEGDKLFGKFLRELDNVALADVSPLTPEELRERDEEARRAVEKLLGKK
ncbi:AAA family ATPase [Rhizobium indicum]|uniref:AAA family ATPase n=1 Tax=Rhizobium indicum TaxID=2583231 RepID=UPI00110633D5|nr:AAA family ATPase [Rhizobium indicum]QKK32324.1 AAA family ATPase [Rhizobium indicum]